MGKGSNVQKKQQAQERANKDRGKTEAERAASKAKSKADAQAFMCEICRQTFMANARPPLLWQHVVAKHPAGTSPTACFPVQLKDFDPEDPNGEKKAAKEKDDKAKAAAEKKKKEAKAAADGLDDLLNAGLGKKTKS